MELNLQLLVDTLANIVRIASNAETQPPTAQVGNLRIIRETALHALQAQATENCRCL